MPNGPASAIVTKEGLPDSENGVLLKFRAISGTDLQGMMGLPPPSADRPAGRPVGPAPEGPTESFATFLAALDQGAVASVDFYGPAGDECYSTYKDGRKVRVYEGFPVEVGNEYSSPMLVVPLLQRRAVPYKFHFLDNVKYNKIGR